MSTPTKLEKQIMATVVYYDILNYPLTVFEIFLYLIKDRGLNGNEYLLSDIVETLDRGEFLQNNLSQKLGFFFLKDREEIVQERLDRKKIADEKWKKAKKIFWIMQIVPFTKLVMASGSFALCNTRKDSDIDLMIVAQKGRIWTVRTFFTLLTIALGVRRYKDRTEDKICLNHYITDQSLKIPFQSLYTVQLYYHILSVYNSEKDRKMFRKFQAENNWMKNYLENYEFSEIESFRSITRNSSLSVLSGFIEFILTGKAGDYLEKKMSKMQSYRIKKDPLHLKKGGRITISDDQLEFHPDSHESHIIPKFNQKMQELGIPEFANQKDSGLNV
ncbi:hypothetical protein K0B03_03755 [Patescibacteria group bacterium]|nr:hypothetical protein [Patescibacteria group bacterium]